MEMQEVEDVYVELTYVKYSIQGMSLCIGKLEESYQAENEEMSMILHTIKNLLEPQLLEIEKQLAVLDHLLIEMHRKITE